MALQSAFVEQREAVEQLRQLQAARGPASRVVKGCSGPKGSERSPYF